MRELICSNDWYLDGNLLYCQHPHAYLFIAAIAVLWCLWLPYTFLLLFIEPLRKVSHLKPLPWIKLYLKHCRICSELVQLVAPSQPLFRGSEGESV